MTNAEKYLKDGVDLADLLERLDKDLNWFRYEEALKGASLDFIKFFNAEERKPTLTEDERVILKNLRYEKGAYEYTKIGRTDLDSEGNCDLILIDSDDESVWWGEYGHLFQFIKERRRI